MIPTQLSKDAKTPHINGVQKGLAPGEVVQKGHPKGLYVLFFTEMWERFSFYGMRALLTLYLIKGLAFTQPQASSIYGWYIGLVYMTPIAGGLLADRVLGYRRTILFGGVLMMIGHFLMAIETRPFLYLAMVFLILGNGAFKPNISTLVGKLYKPGDPRRDAGFSIFYMGINLGAFLSPLICGKLGESNRFGWKYGFAAAGVGMAIGLVTFMLGLNRLSAINIERPDRTDAKHPDDQVSQEEKDKEGGRIVALLIMAGFTIFFWMAFEQAGNTLTLWADQNTIVHYLPIFGELKASNYQSINAGFIILMAPALGYLWVKLGRYQPSTTVKFVLGLFFLGLGFVAMVAAAVAAGSDAGRVSGWWLVLAYFLHTIGELCLSPVGLSLVTKLAPRRMAGMLMGVWFFFVFLGNTLSGLLGGLWSRYPHKQFFGIFVVTSMAAACALALLVKPLKKLIAGAA
jgi:POT family proton-dependent oligopeptide transporter